MTSETVGIIGLGDLGAQLARQVMAVGGSVVGFRRQAIPLTEGYAVDQELEVRDLSRFRRAASANEILTNPDISIVHLCVSSETLGQIIGKASGRLDGKTIILHDSVMNIAGRNLEKYIDEEDRTHFVRVHFLMNESRRVMIDETAPRASEIEQHILDLELAPKYILPANHDRLMARTQGVPALLINLGVEAAAETAYMEGDLTPSGQDLMRFLRKRNLAWTDETMKTILANDELKQVVEEMHAWFRVDAKH